MRKSPFDIFCSIISGLRSAVCGPNWDDELLDPGIADDALNAVIGANNVDAFIDWLVDDDALGVVIAAGGSGDALIDPGITADALASGLAAFVGPAVDGAAIPGLRSAVCGTQLE